MVVVVGIKTLFSLLSNANEPKTALNPKAWIKLVKSIPTTIASAVGII
jgi:hypothetical protein